MSVKITETQLNWKERRWRNKLKCIQREFWEKNGGFNLDFKWSLRNGWRIVEFGINRNFKFCHCFINWVEFTLHSSECRGIYQPVAMWPLMSFYSSKIPTLPLLLLPLWFIRICQRQFGQLAIITGSPTKSIKLCKKEGHWHTRPDSSSFLTRNLWGGNLACITVEGLLNACESSRRGHTHTEDRRVWPIGPSHIKWGTQRRASSDLKR
jgi:hypothetical protein